MYMDAVNYISDVLQKTKGKEKIKQKEQEKEDEKAEA